MNRPDLLNLLLKVRNCSASVEFQDPYHVWVFNMDIFSQIESEIVELEKEEILEANKEVSNDSVKLSLLLTTDIGWFESITDFFKNLRVTIKNEKTFFDDFYINNSTEQDRDKLRKSVDAYKNWCKILTKISDHIEYDRQNWWPTYIFVMEGGKSKKITTYKLPLKNLEDSFLIDIDTEPCDMDTLTSADLHSYERKLVMRSSLIELYNEFSEKELFLSDILKKPYKLWELFSLNYEIYINKYSINKVINDVEIQKLDFLSKLNSLVQEHQTKSLTIPAVLVSTAIIKGWTSSGLLLIFVAMLLTCAVVIIGIRNAKNSLNDIIESSDKTMELFTKENTDDVDLALTQKVNSVITNALEKLRHKKESADRILTFLEGLIYFGCLIWLLFVLYQFKDNIVDILIFFTSN